MVSVEPFIPNKWIRATTPLCLDQDIASSKHQMVNLDVWHGSTGTTPPRRTKAAPCGNVKSSDYKLSRGLAIMHSDLVRTRKCGDPNTSTQEVKVLNCRKSSVVSPATHISTSTRAVPGSTYVWGP